MISIACRSWLSRARIARTGKTFKLEGMGIPVYIILASHPGGAGRGTMDFVGDNATGDGSCIAILVVSSL